MGLTESPAALLRWMIAGPEITRLVNEFGNHSDKQTGKHHEQSRGVQTEFRKDVCMLTEVLQGNNPFIDDGKERITLDTNIVMDPAVIHTIQNV